MQYEIYGTDDCGLCDKAKRLLLRHDKAYTFINVSESQDVRTAFFKRFPGITTVPQIMYDGVDRGYPVHIGGYNELKKWLDIG